MKALAILAMCLMIAPAALAGDGGSRYCEPCTNIIGQISPTPEYQTISGSIVANGDATYSFCAVGGGSYTFTFCEGGGSASYDTAMSIQGPDVCGAYLACNDDFCSLYSQVDFVAPADGTYLVVVDAYSSNAGSFVLAYRGPECAPNPTENTTWGAIKSIYR